MSSPHYPQSNSHAEASVKAMKSLIAKTTMNGDLDMDAFRQALMEWRNTPDASGRSPAQKLYGQPLQSFVFAHSRGESKFLLRILWHEHDVVKQNRRETEGANPLQKTLTFKKVFF